MKGYHVRLKKDNVNFFIALSISCYYFITIIYLLLAINNNNNIDNNNNNNNNNDNNNNNPPQTRKYWFDVQQDIASSHGEKDPI